MKFGNLIELCLWLIFGSGRDKWTNHSSRSLQKSYFCSLLANAKREQRGRSQVVVSLWGQCKWQILVSLRAFRMESHCICPIRDRLALCIKKFTKNALSILYGIPSPPAVSPVEFVALQYTKFNPPGFLSSELYVSPVKRVRYCINK